MAAVPRAKAGIGRFALRLLVSAVLLAVLVVKAPSFDDVIPDANHARSVALLLGAVAMALVGLVLQAWRWQRVLVVYGDRPPLQRLVSHTFAGQFVGNVLPTTIGGDVLRVSRAGRTIDSNERAFASVVLERLTGFVALPLLVVLGFALRPALLGEDHAWIALLVAGITFGVLGALMALAAHERAAGRFVQRDNWLRFLGALHVGVDRMRREPALAASALGAALVYQASTVATVALVCAALDLPVPIAAVIAFAPAVAMTQVLLPTVNGLGAREGMFVLLLVPLGVTQAEAIAVGLLWYGTTLVASAFGAPAFAVGHRADRAAAEATGGTRGEGDEGGTEAPRFADDGTRR